MKVAAAFVLALGSAVALNWGFVAQYRVAAALPPLELRRPVHSLWSLFRARRWLTGFLAGIGGWVLYLGALALAPLSIVQAAAAGGIGILALLVPDRLTRLERRGIVLALVGLVLLAVSLGGSTAGGRGSTILIVLWLLASLGAASFVGGGLRSGAALGLAAGTMYAAGDVATKALAGARYGFLPVMFAAHGLGFVFMQLGFQRGRALTTIGLSTLLTNALPIAAGIVLFDEATGVLRLVSFALVVAAAVLLGRAQAGSAHGASAAAQGSQPGALP